MLDAPHESRQALVESYWADVERTITYQRELVGHLSRTLSGGKDSYRCGSDRSPRPVLTANAMAGMRPSADTRLLSQETGRAINLWKSDLFQKPLWLVE